MIPLEARPVFIAPPPRLYTEAMSQAIYVAPVYGGYVTGLVVGGVGVRGILPTLWLN